MNARTNRDGDDGFTLVEMVIALLVMATAVVTIVGALSAMVELTGQHRGHAVTEVAARSFSEAAQQQARATTTLTQAVDVDDSFLTVASTSHLPRVDGTNTFVVVDREVMRVTGMPSATRIDVVRDHNEDGTVEGHTAGSQVAPVLRCPTAAQLTPEESTYAAAEGIEIVLTDVEYWDTEEGEFVGDRNSCINGRHSAPLDSNGFDENCDDPDSTAIFVLPSCGWRYFRATVEVSTPGDGRLREVTTSTKVLLRSASA